MVCVSEWVIQLKWLFLIYVVKNKVCDCNKYLLNLMIMNGILGWYGRFIVFP